MYSFQRGGILRTISIETALVLGCFFIALGPARAELRYDIQGVWTGKYVCRPQGATAGTLSIAGTNPRQLTARFRFSPPPENSRAPSGEFELIGHYDPASGAISLRPTRWIDQPPGYGMVGIAGALAPDGQLQVRFMGASCGSFTLALSNEKPSLPPAAAAPPAASEPAYRPGAPGRRPLASVAAQPQPTGAPIEGEWEGRSKCGRTSYDVSLQVTGASPPGDFQALQTRFGPNALLEPTLATRFIARFNEPDGVYQFVPQAGPSGGAFTGRLSPGGDTLSLSMKDCEPLVAHKVTETALTRKPSVSLPQESRYRQEDSVPRRCDALIEWASRVTTEYPNLDMMKTMMSRIYPAAVFLFADDDFVPTFGVTYERSVAGGQRMIWDDVRFNCGKDPFIRSKGGWVWGHPLFDKVFRGVQPGDFSVPAVIHATREIRRVRNEVIARQSVGATGNFNERAKDIAGNREWLKLQNGFLWPSEIKRFDNLISERKVILSKDIVASWLAEMKKLDASASTIGKISEGLRTNAQYIQDLSASEKAALNRDLAIKLNELLALQERDPARLMPVPTFLADLKTLDAIVAARDEVAIRETRERISRVLAIMLGKALPEMDNFAPTLDGFASFAGWQAEIRNKYEPFPAYDPVKRAQAQLTEKANALGPVVQTALREELTERTIEELFVSYLEGPGVDDFVRVRSKLAGIEGSLKNPVVSGPLWEEYEIAVSRWMQKAVDAAPRVPQAPTAANRTVSAAPDQSPLGGLERLPGARVQSGGSNGFLSSNLSEPRVVSAIHRKDFGSIYKDDPARVGGYLIYLQKGVQDRCPGVMSTADKRAAMREAFGIDLADLSGERVSKLGLEAAKSFLNKLMNPAELIRDSLQEQEFSDKGDRDAQYLAEAVGCSPATWQGFFTNMIAYFRDRTDGMNPDDLTLTDLCARQATAKFCSCAGPAMETSLTGIQQKFVRVNAKTNIAIARKLLPRMDGALRKCG